MGQRTCTWPGCGKAEPRMSRSLCNRHYKRSRGLGHPVDPWLLWTDGTRKTASCKWPECDGQGTRHQMCVKHYNRAVKLGDMDSPWLSWNPAKPCLQCGAMFRGRRPKKKYCSAECSASAYNARNPNAQKQRAARWLQANHDRHRMKEHRRRAQKVSTSTEGFTEADVRDAYGENCYLCGVEVDFLLRWPDRMSPSLDHVVPLVAGGTHTLYNVAMVHLICNISKGSRLASRSPVKVSTVT